jgi:hypothetical protein
MAAVVGVGVRLLVGVGVGLPVGVGVPVGVAVGVPGVGVLVAGATQDAPGPPVACVESVVDPAAPLLALT